MQTRGIGKDGYRNIKIIYQENINITFLYVMLSKYPIICPMSVTPGIYSGCDVRRPSVLMALPVDS